MAPEGEAVSIITHESRVYHGSNAISVHPITAGSAKLPDWLIREVKVFGNNIRGPQERP